MENITSQKFGRCLLLPSIPYEQPYLLKPIFLFNEEVFIPAGRETRLGILQNLNRVTNNPSLNRILEFFNLYEFDNSNLPVWLYLIYYESNLRSIFRDRLSKLRMNWKTILIKSYPAGFLCDDFTSEEGLNYAAEKAQEIFVGSALATQNGLTFCGDDFQAMLSTLPIYGELPIDLFKESLYIKNLRYSTSDKEAFIIIQNFAMSNYKSKLNNSGIKSLPLVLTREFPAIHDLDFKQIIELRDKNKINSLYQWLLRLALKKNFDIKNATPDSVADFLQDSLWKLASSVEPDISSETAKVLISNIPIPILPINPIGITTGINDLIRAKKVKEEFEGLFILSSLFASKYGKRH